MHALFTSSVLLVVLPHVGIVCIVITVCFVCNVVDASSVNTVLVVCRMVDVCIVFIVLIVCSMVGA